MYLGVIADDFTGASDIANTLAKGALATMQFFGIPSGRAPEDCDAGVVSLKTRSIDPEQAMADSLRAFAWLKAQGCRQYIFKYCSTFDSTPRGNIGPVGEALAAALGVRGVPVCPAFPTTGRTIYQGHLFVGDRLLNESGLENHPLNPMTDADIRRWLALQSKHPVGLVPWPVVQSGPQAIREMLNAAAVRDEWLVIVDAVTDGDLINIGEACADAPLLTGGSGIAIGLPQIIIGRGFASGRSKPFRGGRGAGAILAGSCSRATLAQVETYKNGHPALAIDVDKVIDGTLKSDGVADFIAGNRGQDPIVYSSAAPDKVRALQARYGQERVAHALEQLFADAATRIVTEGFDRLVVAGGETSGAVVSGLKLPAVTIGPEIDPGVPALATEGRAAVALALKSGNFGGADFFSKALRMLGGGG
jgi:3-dehydrotetronate 4-kinase